VTLQTDLWTIIEYFSSFNPRIEPYFRLVSFAIIDISLLDTLNCSDNQFISTNAYPED
jgi:hypothetical protein